MMKDSAQSPAQAKEPLQETVYSRIKALSEDVVNKIAAGEIIVAPVHALKELIENAVDAGATSLEVLVKDGGLKLLQITDNGSGIHKDDLPILCERFTTSKLKLFEDLTSIATYGFRGEALASISHIAHLQVTTKTRESSCAWRAHYAGGTLVPAKPGQTPDPKPTAGRQGTQITVEDLFYNMPTRRKAFRSATDELNKILDLVNRYSVHCQGIAFSCKKHGDASMNISISAAASTGDRVRQIYGSNLGSELIQLEASSDTWGFKASGWISNANYHAKRTTLLVFINHRAVESSAIKRAVEQTYSNFLPKGSHPFLYLSLEIDPARVDVNVHPTKKEVNFLNEDEIIDLICQEISERLGKVDTSRTFATQTLLPGVKVPTVGSGSTSDDTRVRELQGQDTPKEDNHEPRGPAKTSQAKRPYENNLVRTDAKIQKITSMFSHVEHPASTDVPKEHEDHDNSQEKQPNDRTDADGDNTMQYETTDREYTPCRLTSVKELRTSVRDSMNDRLCDVFASHTFVGIVDDNRRIVAMQAGVKLLLVDYGMVCNEFFYQLALTEFGNFGIIELDPPLRLRELLEIGAEFEKERPDSEADESFDWDFAINKVEEQILERRDMLDTYFSFRFSDDGYLETLPLLIKGYLPSMAKLPQFLLRLGPCVDWTEEKPCFYTFLRELASWYVPESLPPEPPPRPSESDPNAADTMNVDQEEEGVAENSKEPKEDPEIAARRKEIHEALENVFFPAFKQKLVATEGMQKGVVEVANLKGLYRVFERC